MLVLAKCCSSSFSS